MSVIMETNFIRENVLNNLTNKLNGVNLVIVYFEENNTYVNLKTKLSESLGVNVRTYLLDIKVDNKYVLDLINKFNNDNMVDGIIVQLPLPENLDKDKILNSICWYKDVDGISSISVNRYLCKKECLVSPLVRSVISTMNYYNIDINKKVFIKCDDVNTNILLNSLFKNKSLLALESDVIIIISDNIFDQEVKENVIVIDGGYNKINGEVVGCVSKRIKSISSMYTKEIGGINNLVIPYLLDNLYRIKNIKRV